MVGHPAWGNIGTSGGHSGPRRDSRTERRHDVSVQTQYLNGDVLDAVPTIALFLALVLTALGVIAHAAFA